MKTLKPIITIYYYTISQRIVKFNFAVSFFISHLGFGHLTFVFGHLGVRDIEKNFRAVIMAAENERRDSYGENH